jgi:ornithine carbamoyltransferase
MMLSNELGISTGRAILTLRDIPDPEIRNLCALAVTASENPARFRMALRGAVIGLLFAGTSTRTRSSFWRGALDMGASVMPFGPGDLQTNTGETLEDTGRVLANVVDALVVRTNGPLDELKALAVHLGATINAMSRCEHPTQALADYVAVHEHFGSADGLRIAYFGEGNNTAAAIALLFSAVPHIDLAFFVPAGYAIRPEILEFAIQRAARNGGRVAMHHALPKRPNKADIIYTTRWQTMGVVHAEADWRESFVPFQVNAPLFEKFSVPGRTVFMHDLPAVRGDEVTADVLDGPDSIAWRQAYHKLSSAKGALLWALGVHGPCGSSSCKKLRS